MTELILFIARLVNVFASAFQQKNVAGDHYLMVPFPSIVRAICDYASWAIVAVQATSASSVLDAATSITLMGVAATLGTWAGMWAHNRMVRGAEQ